MEQQKSEVPEKLIQQLKIMSAWFESDGWEANASIVENAADEIERLRERCEAYKGQVECGAQEIERLRGDYSHLEECNKANMAEVTRLSEQLVLQTARSDLAVENRNYWQEEASRLSEQLVSATDILQSLSPLHRMVTDQHADKHDNVTVGRTIDLGTLRRASKFIAEHS